MRLVKPEPTACSRSGADRFVCLELPGAGSKPSSLFFGNMLAGFDRLACSCPANFSRYMLAGIAGVVMYGAVLPCGMEVLSRWRRVTWTDRKHKVRKPRKA